MNFICILALILEVNMVNTGSPKDFLSCFCAFLCEMYVFMAVFCQCYVLVQAIIVAESC